MISRLQELLLLGGAGGLLFVSGLIHGWVLHAHKARHNREFTLRYKSSAADVMEEASDAWRGKTSG